MADGPEAWVAALRRLEADAELRERLGRQGREFVERRYAAAHTGERLLRILGL